jgi:chemotaxis signal transduction protein
MTDQVVRLVYFELAGQKFAFNMEQLVEIVQVRVDEIQPCFARVPLIRGQWQYRERLLYVIDLRDFFGLTEVAVPLPTPGKLAPAQSIVVVKIHAQLFGLLTDTVYQIVPLNIFYEYPDLISHLPRRYFAGVSRVQNQLVLILALEELVNTYELEALFPTEQAENV